MLIDRSISFDFTVKTVQTETATLSSISAQRLITTLPATAKEDRTDIQQSKI